MDNEMLTDDVKEVEQDTQETQDNAVYVAKTYQWDGKDVQIIYHLPFYEMMEMVNDVAGCCFNEDAGFMPELMDFAFRVNVVARYSNMVLPENLDEKYDAVYGTDFVEFILEHVHQQQLKAMVKAINRKIEYICNANIEELRRRTNQIVEGLEGVQKEIGDIFAGVNSGDVAKLVEEFAKNGYNHVDEEKIVKALFNKEHAEKPKTDTEA